MKIEKLSEKQIRCTLNREDLVDRELRISELAYGTEKAKALFRDMMQQANYEFGFEAEDIPLMIEAIPVSAECLILLITKVDDPDELDTRFSKFSSSTEDDLDDTYDDDDDDSYADEIINSIEQITDLLDDNITEQKDDFFPLSDILSESDKKTDTEDGNETKSVSISTNLIKIYSFKSLDEVIQLSSIISPYYNGINSVYKNPVSSIYYLVLTKSEHTPEDYNKICNIISEYGRVERSTYASQYYYDEHYEVIVKDKAIQILSSL